MTLDAVVAAAKWNLAVKDLDPQVLTITLAAREPRAVSESLLVRRSG
jgi:hypothetical protein